MDGWGDGVWMREARLGSAIGFQESSHGLVSI